MAYVNRAVTHTLLGNDNEAQKDADRAVELGFDRANLDNRIEGAKTQR